MVMARLVFVAALVAVLVGLLVEQAAVGPVAGRQQSAAAEAAEFAVALVQRHAAE